MRKKECSSSAKKSFSLSIPEEKHAAVRAYRSGIVIGITTVITVTSIINGLNENVLGGIRELGSDTIIAYRFPWASLSRPPSEWFTRKELQPEWADDIALLPSVKAASASMRIFQPQFGSGTEDVRRGAYRAKT